MPDREFTNINGIKVCDQTARDNMPTRTSQLTNDSDFATNASVDSKIAQAGSGGSVDLTNYAKKSDIPIKTSQLTNDSGYITSIPGEYITENELNDKGYVTTSQIPTVPTNVSAFTNDSNYATQTYVANKIAEASLSGGEVDLSGYVTKETGNANQITFSDGQTFQAKLDAGTLKGDKGDKGDAGAIGPQGPQGPAGANGLTTSILLNGVTYTQQDGVITLPNISSGGEIVPVAQVEPEELDMPKVFFYGEALPTEKVDVLLTMDYISNTDKFSSYIKLKCQGTSSMSYAKKNFTVNMYSDEARTTKLKKDFKGWGKQSKFCLKANYVDTTHTRNISGARIAYDMVQSRPDSAFKQQLLTAPRGGAVDGFPVKLYFNGEFYGIYTWNIPKDGWMFNMDKSNANQMVLCAEKNNDSTNTNDDILRCEFRKEWDGTDGNSWSIEFGTYSDALKNSFNRCVNFVMTATDEEFKTNIGQYFDLYSLLDYYCFTYFTAHIDGLAKNMLMATYDGVIWGASLYDMDSIYGADWDGTSYKTTNIQCPEQYQETNSLLWQRIEQCFSTELYARYLELRQGALSLGNVIKHVEEIYDVIPDRVFADEKAKWTGLPGISTNTMTRFRNYMRDRAAYVDAEMAEIGKPKISCTGITLSTNSLSFTTTDTQTITATVEPSNTTDVVTWSVSPTGIVTVDGGVVTPIANGNCTITATCGTQSATCNVTVSGISEGGGDIFATAEYTLTEATTFNGTSDYIDTGIQLFDTAKDFTLFIDYTPTVGITQQSLATIFHCAHEEAPYRGLCLMTTGTYFIGGQGTSTSYVTDINDANHKFIIRFTNGVIHSVKDISKGVIEDVPLQATSTDNPYVQVTENLLLGCYQNTSGTKGRYWNGTINKFAVWFKQLTDNELNEIVSMYNLLEGVSWSANANNGIYNNTSQGALGAEKGAGNGDSYLSGQIPCGKGKYVLNNINGATFNYKEMYVYASDGTFLGGCYEGGKYNTNLNIYTSSDPTTMDLRNISEEPAYMKITAYPNNVDTNNDPANQLSLIEHYQ